MLQSPEQFLQPSSKRSAVQYFGVTMFEVLKVNKMFNGDLKDVNIDYTCLLDPGFPNILFSFSLMCTVGLEFCLLTRSDPEVSVQLISRIFGSWSCSIFLRSSPFQVLSTRETNRTEFDHGALGSPNLKQSTPFPKILYKSLRQNYVIYIDIQY